VVQEDTYLQVFKFALPPRQCGFHFCTVRGLHGKAKITAQRRLFFVNRHTMAAQGQHAGRFHACWASTNHSNSLWPRAQANIADIMLAPCNGINHA
jgi:hypothetical protein